ncbi:DUF58 domain-containing protein [soil metagenome]
MGLTSAITRLKRSPRAADSEDPGLPAIAPDQAPLFDEELLARLRKLVVLSRRAVAQGIAGDHKSRRRGSSPEFSDFKSYSQGDDFRRIDWNIYSRLDELFIRLSEVTTELTVHILIDASNSMAWRGSEQTPSKFAYARRLAGSMAYVSLWHFDRVVITPFSDQPAPSYGPVQGRSHIQRTLKYLTLMQPSGTTNVLESIQRYTSARSQQGMLIVISDLLSGDPENLSEGLRFARNRGWQTSIFHIVDAAELSPAPYVRNKDSERPVTLELVELEHGERLRVTPTDDLIERYRTSVDRWQAELEAVCLAEKADYVLLQTDWPFESQVLSRLFEAGLVA